MQLILNCYLYWLSIFFLLSHKIIFTREILLFRKLTLTMFYCLLGFIFRYHEDKEHNENIRLFRGLVYFYILWIDYVMRETDLLNVFLKIYYTWRFWNLLFYISFKGNKQFKCDDDTLNNSAKILFQNTCFNTLLFYTKTFFFQLCNITFCSKYLQRYSNIFNITGKIFHT